MLRKLLVVAAAAALAACGPGACTEERAAPKSQVFVLVDMSETWHGPSFAAKNRRVLSEVGEGIVIGLRNWDTPVGVQYRTFGGASVGREPICDVVYTTTLAPTKSTAEYEIKQVAELKRFLGFDCPHKIVAQKGEPLTEITAALISIASQDAGGSPRRYLIVLSDFLEETPNPVPLTADLEGWRVLLLYRPVPADLSNPAAMRARIDQWKQALVAVGADVADMPDTGLKRTAVADFLVPAVAQ
ncbi:MAG TPA: hypothetical protein VFZ91_07030 [Allosphingosinicella sp.]